MSYRKKIGVLFVVAIVAFLIDIFLYNLGSQFDYIGEPLGMFSAVLFLLSIILFFTKETVFRTWWKFAIPYIIFSILLIAISPSSNAGIYGLDSELIAWFTSGLFLIISLLIIAIKSWKSKSR